MAICNTRNTRSLRSKAGECLYWKGARQTSTWIRLHGACPAGFGLSVAAINSAAFACQSGKRWRWSAELTGQLRMDAGVCQTPQESMHRSSQQRFVTTSGEPAKSRGLPPSVQIIFLQLLCWHQHGRPPCMLSRPASVVSVVPLQSRLVIRASTC